MERNPYRLEGPLVVSFSGGSTSAFMLSKIIEAWEGILPHNIVPVFANTGIEHEKTYDFINDYQIHMGIKIRWVEYVSKRNFKEVDYLNSSRNGKPFDDVIFDRQYLPNPVTRFCTSEMKIKTMDRFVRTIPGFEDNYTECLGLRFDEPARVSKSKSGKYNRDIECPMYDAKHTLKDVELYWSLSPFRLNIPRLFSNCVGCFLKGAGKLDMIARDNPAHLEWFAKREETSFGVDANGKEKKGIFRSDRPSYRNLIRMAKEQPLLIFPDDDTMPCNCTD
jgi:3'-phosphoadenosine 5'-phosphosulfate sulfotransferase (PAPS reductase)/FAD synthetase